MTRKLWRACCWKRAISRRRSAKDANLVIFNTCSIRENADKRFFGTLGQLKKKKTELGDNFTVCVCGCMMQQQHVIDTIKAKYPWVDVIFGTNNLHQLPELLDKLYQEKQKQLAVWQDGGEIVEGLPAKRLYRHKAFVNIMYGCNNFCTYCIVPYTRGQGTQPEAGGYCGRNRKRLSMTALGKSCCLDRMLILIAASAQTARRRTLRI